MPSVLLWWLIPAVAVAVAIAVLSWRGRTKAPTDPETGMADFQRFRQAMSRPMPSGNLRTVERSARAETATSADSASSADADSRASRGDFDGLGKSA